MMTALKDECFHLYCQANESIMMAQFLHDFTWNDLRCTLFCAFQTTILLLLLVETTLS
jgi:hypothetical protein